MASPSKRGRKPKPYVSSKGEVTVGLRKRSHDGRWISVADLRAIVGEAKGQDLAMVMLMLNGAFYMKEVLALRWSDLDLEKRVIVTHRKKRGQVIRVCVLWSETIEALNGMQRRGEVLFTNYAGSPLTASGGQLRFSKLAESAKVEVTPS